MMLQGNDLELWGNIAIIISIINTVAVALEDFFDFGVRSASRRTAANHMEKAFWEFQALAGQYRFFTNHRAAFRRFVEDAETITNKAEEIYVKTIMENAGGAGGKKDDGGTMPRGDSRQDGGPLPAGRAGSPPSLKIGPADRPQRILSTTL